MIEGWVKMPRTIRDHWTWQKPYSEGQAWLDLIIRACFKPTKIIYNSNPINLKRGEYFTSLRNLAEDWRWSTDKTNCFLDKLERCGDIKQTKQQRGPLRGRLVFINDYDSFQGITQYKTDTNIYTKPTTIINKELNKEINHIEKDKFINLLKSSSYSYKTENKDLELSELYETLKIEFPLVDMTDVAGRFCARQIRPGANCHNYIRKICITVLNDLLQTTPGYIKPVDFDAD